MASSAAMLQIKQQKRSIIDHHATPNDLEGLRQALTTLLPLATLWIAATLSASWSYGLTAIVTLVMSLFLLRSFVLMHECGHGSLFRDQELNKAFGFVFGVVVGMPQYVWAQHHNHHHATNGNWEKYRGPLAIFSVDEYDTLTKRQQRAYRRARMIWLAPLAGFLYLIVNPRLTWLRGSAGFVRHIIRSKILQPHISLRTHAAQFSTRDWNSVAEYWHMTSNNLVLLSLWGLMSWAIGPALFFAVYIVSTSLAGAVGIVLFTVQHNFEHSYAGSSPDWDYDEAAIHGSSYLALPAWLDWFTANIGYHHIHHLSARIPNYRLADCHAEHQQLFVGVRRLTLADIGRSLKFLLWDGRSRRLISTSEHEAGKIAVA